MHFWARQAAPAIIIAFLIGCQFLGGSTFAQVRSLGALMQEADRLKAKGAFKEAEAVLEKALAIKPDNVDALLLLGLVRGFQNKFNSAIHALERALILSPGYIDVAIARARILSWQKKLDAAEAAVDAVLKRAPRSVAALILSGRIAYLQTKFGKSAGIYQKVLALQPSDLEARIGLGRALTGAGEYQIARNVLEQALKADPTSPLLSKAILDLDAAENASAVPERQAPPPERPWRLDLGGSQSLFSRSNNKKWRDGTLSLSHRFGADTSVRLGHLFSRRFGLTDTTMEASISHRFYEGFNGAIAIAVTPSADFLPRWELSAAGALRALDNVPYFGDSWLTLTARQRHYKTGNIRAYNPGLRQVLLDGRLEVSGQFLHTHDAKADSHLNGWSWRIGIVPWTLLRLYVGRSKGPETDEGASRDVYSIFGGASVDISESLAIRIDAVREKRKQSFIRDKVSTALTLKF